MNYKNGIPKWLHDYLGISAPKDNDEIDLAGQKFILRNGILRNQRLLSNTQAQTEETFGFKWKKRDTFDSEASLSRMRSWLIERYGDIASADWLTEHGENPILIDAGCGAGMSTLELFGSLLPHIRYLGIDVSSAVDVAATRFTERKLPGTFMQVDISKPPFPPNSVDLIFSEGVLHHTDSTKESLLSLARLLKKGGRFMFNVYHRKGPVREFTDDYIRDKLQTMMPQQAWEAMEPLTQLGITLGEIEGEIDIPQPIDMLGIPAGRTSIQRLFYWHVAKAFYDPNLTFEEMNHINYDWYAPSNCSRHTPEELREWCAEGGLMIEREVVENSGITIIAKKDT
ncbi:MAG: class I SAM-dependent methyltransferase [Nitrospinae bacterium]|nr:class I SAM-dependent methyltransferase [Nitrospinota bacterium]